MNMQNIMAQAQKMQKEIVQKKEEITKREFSGKNGFVEVILTGDKKVKKIIINNDDFTSEDKEMLEDMLVIAQNQAVDLIEKETAKALGQYGGALNGLF